MNVKFYMCTNLDKCLIETIKTNKKYYASILFYSNNFYDKISLMKYSLKK